MGSRSATMEAEASLDAGLGPLTIGLPPETNPGAAMIVHHPDECAGLSDINGRGPGRWVATYPPFVDAEGNAHPQFWVDANDVDHVQGPGTNPDWTSANTDLVAGGCL
ncbi:hypothetical protein [Pengzhenrongella phosphoraccumulans]|uniref:hypothetical protein n=1 Tax=Pengzhenrongella phosphoraccumulans TaxID=3114394 RepID=UPI003890AD70